MGGMKSQPSMMVAGKGCEVTRASCLLFLLDTLPTSSYPQVTHRPRWLTMSAEPDREQLLDDDGPDSPSEPMFVPILFYCA